MGKPRHEPGEPAAVAAVWRAAPEQTVDGRRSWNETGTERRRPEALALDAVEIATRSSRGTHQRNRGEARRPSREP